MPLLIIDNYQKNETGVLYMQDPKTRMAPLGLRQNFSWTFLGNVTYSVCQWGVLAIPAKLSTSEMTGKFMLGIAIANPVIMFFNLQLRAVQATDAKRDFAFGDYLGLRLITTLLAVVVIAGIVAVTRYAPGTALVILAVALVKGVEALSDVIFGLLQQRQRMDRIAKSMIVKGLLSLVGMGLGVYLTDNIFWGVVGLLAARVLLLFTYDISSTLLILRSSMPKLDDMPSARVLLRPNWTLDTLKRLAWLALPLGFVMMMISLNINFPRYLVERYLGVAMLGIFGPIAYIQALGATAVGALGRAATPVLAEQYAAGKSAAFIRLLLKLLVVSVLLGIIGIIIALLAGREVLSLLYRPEYAEHANLFIWLMVAGAITYIASSLGYGMTAARYFRAQIPLFLIVTGITAAACYLLIPMYGLLGASAALIAAAIVQVLGSLIVIRHALYNIPVQR